MNSTKLYLTYMSEFNAFCIADDVIAANPKAEVLFRKNDYSKLGRVIFEDKPLIGFLLGREKGFYSIDYNYAKAIVQSGVNIRFLTYENIAEQMSGLHGLILPGGAFSSPDRFYMDGQELYEPNRRYEAYETAIRTAENLGIPILGICAGAQMIAALHGMRLYRNVHSLTDVNHKSRELAAHNVEINQNSMLGQILGCRQILTNSRHNEAVRTDIPSDLIVCAKASDGIAEAWENEKKGILCIQWHPEDFAAKGITQMQAIYDWLAVKALNYSLLR